MKIRRNYLLLVSMVAFAIAALPITTHGQTAADPEIIVIGEVQGAANTVAAFLEHLDLIDSEHHWSGGDTILIQTGDLIDDGEHAALPSTSSWGCKKRRPPPVARSSS